MAYTVRWRALRVDPVRIDVRRAEREVEDYVRGFLAARVRALWQYPSPVPGSKYVRTGDLQRSWRFDVRRTSSEVVGYLWNIASDRKSGRQYMTYVQGPWQTPQHAQTGWYTISSSREASQKAYRAGLQAIYSKYIRKTP